MYAETMGSAVVMLGKKNWWWTVGSVWEVVKNLIVVIYVNP